MLQGKSEEVLEVVYTYIPENMENDHPHAFTNIDFKKSLLASVNINFTHIRSSKYHL